MPYPLDHRAKSGDPGATRTPSISVRSAAFFPLNYGAERWYAGKDSNLVLGLIWPTGYKPA